MPPMPPMPPDSPASSTRLWLGYALLAMLCWVLYAAAGTDWLRGTRTIWDGLYEASWDIGLPLLIGPLLLPWVRRVQPCRLRLRLPLHALGALGFISIWLLLDFLAASFFFGGEHAIASFEQALIWRAASGLLIYAALVFGFGGVLHARAAAAAALRAAQAEGARVQAELAAVSSRLNPHFLFNTLNSLLMLLRRDAAAAESALLAFARLMRYSLDSTRRLRVPLGDELDFVRDYLSLEQLRLGERLRIDWQVNGGLDEAEIPPLSLQPLVENAVLHAISPRREGGRLQISAQERQGMLQLAVSDDGPGCHWPPARAGVGLSALERRFALDYQGRARFHIRTRPGDGFAVELLIPLDDA